ncbi:uncharacterized protein PAC_08484 [Phialocephala subalpina]|uniref:TauD/TfdA-like domain-containing protein n=1 Tax=Phialocephala subalpina TaxID=576137 RepID=A0A1L7X0P1_9HELO|nr:uncharacterized protein PAC_08484 [Phialocephala subalpina]
MSTSTITEALTKPLEALSLPVEEQPLYSKVPGGWEVEFKGHKWFTGTIPNDEYTPPKDFVFPGNSSPVPLNPKGQTEIPQKLTADYTDYEFTNYLAHVTLSDEAPLEPYDHVDCAFRADPEKKALFDAGMMPLELLQPRADQELVVKKMKDMTPSIGTEVKGVQLSSLSSQQKDELALWAAERGEYGSHFGRLHVHSFGSHMKGHPEILSNLRDSDKTVFDHYSAGYLTTTRWHSDMTYEKNPMGTTFLCALDVPECGGDTLYLNNMDAYDKLSEPMKVFLEGLSAVHSGAQQSIHGKKSSVYRRELVETVHPIVRKHPVTGRKALWFPPEYVAGIVGLKKEESDAITAMLFSHLEKSLDFHTRATWEKGTVVVYDNRMVLHSVVLDYALKPNAKRHHIRITPQAERPIPAREP